MAADTWAGMSEDEKKKYRDKEGSIDSSSIRSVSKESSQVTLLDRKKQKQLAEKKRMQDRIDKMVKSIPIIDLSIGSTVDLLDFTSFPIFLMYGNYFYRNFEGEYSPAEIAIAKYTFRRGIEKTYHTFVNPGRPEIGYAAAAKEHTEATHGLPLPYISSMAFGEEDLNRINYLILQFLSENGASFDNEKPVVFTYTDKYRNEENQLDILNSFLKSFSYENQLDIDVLPLEAFFSALHQKLVDKNTTDPLPSQHSASVILSRDQFDATPGISCKYHDEEDRAKYCALSQVVRWSCVMSDHFCPIFGLRMIAGVHLPRGIVKKRARGINISSGLQGSQCSQGSQSTLNFSASIRSSSVSSINTDGDSNNSTGVPILSNISSNHSDLEI